MPIGSGFGQWICISWSHIILNNPFARITRFIVHFVHLIEHSPKTFLTQIIPPFVQRDHAIFFRYIYVAFTRKY